MHNELVEKNPCCRFCGLVLCRKSLSIPTEVVSDYENILEPALGPFKRERDSLCIPFPWVRRSLC